jgi:hypothetical protein
MVDTRSDPVIELILARSIHPIHTLLDVQPHVN